MLKTLVLKKKPSLDKVCWLGLKGVLSWTALHLEGLVEAPVEDGRVAFALVPSAQAGQRCDGVVQSDEVSVHLRA